MLSPSFDLARSNLETLLPSSVELADNLLALSQTHMTVSGRDRIPDGAFIAIGNHRGLMDPIVIAAALQREVHFACHYFMTQVPLLRQAIDALGCIPLQQNRQGQTHFFRTAKRYLQNREAIALFPEGGTNMTRRTDPKTLAPFHPGFAHLALRSRVAPVAILPIAIRVRSELFAPDIPMPLFRLFDPLEPTFQSGSGHPVVIYRDIEVDIAPPIWVDGDRFNPERGPHLREAIDRLVFEAREAIRLLLHR